MGARGLRDHKGQAKFHGARINAAATESNTNSKAKATEPAGGRRYDGNGARLRATATESKAKTDSTSGRATPAYLFFVELICDSIFASTAFTSSICCCSFFSASSVLSEPAAAEAGCGFEDVPWPAA